MTGSHRSETHHRRFAVVAVLIGTLAVAGALAATHYKLDRRNQNAAAKPQHQSSATVSAGTPTVVLTPLPLSTKSPAATGSPTVTGSPKPAAPITYTVVPGDNLTVIAAWFHLHGYGELYERNKAVLGDNPSLIHPGQRITIADGAMTTAG